MSSQSSEAITGLSRNGNRLIVEWRDGRESAYLYLWLRDNSPQSKLATEQRLIETTAIPDDVHPESVALTAGGDVEIIWADDGHVSIFPAAWLRAHSHPDAPGETTRLWDANIMAHMPEARYAEIENDPAVLREWLAFVDLYGFAMLHDVPLESGMVAAVAELFGYVRETNYGRYFDVMTQANPANLANSSATLSPHTDNPYREPVPTLQLLHCLATDIEGGDSILVDGFRVAAALREAHPEQFSLLTSHHVTFRYRDETADLESTAPVIQLNSAGEVVAIRYNNRSIAPLSFEIDLTEAFYRAYRAFGNLLLSREFQATFRLGAGDLFIVDNRRVLHGRTGLSDVGSRHLQGCYADVDGLLSRLRVLQDAV